MIPATSTEAHPAAPHVGRISDSMEQMRIGAGPDRACPGRSVATRGHGGAAAARGNELRAGVVVMDGGKELRPDPGVYITRCVGAPMDCLDGPPPPWRYQSLTL